jgi:hypothetical protein
MSRTTRWLAGTNALLGAWLVVAPFLLDTSTAGLYSDVLVGVLVATLGAYNYYLAGSGREVNRVAAIVNAMAGLRLIAAPVVLRGVAGAAFRNDVIVGALVALFAGYNAYASRVARARRGGQPAA